MQNQYVGDIGDFGKYGMLRCLFFDMKLGIVWYLVPNETNKNDGRHTAYLGKSTFRKCDPILFDNLQALIANDLRSVEQVQQLNLFGGRTVFHACQLTYAGIKAYGDGARKIRLRHRQEWLHGAIETTRGCDVVFLDPDNGIEVASVPKHAKASPKYVFLDEIRQFASQHQTVVVYHHLGRQGKHAGQINNRKKQLTTFLGDEYSIFALCFAPYSPRAYFIITVKANTEAMLFKLDRMVRQEWECCFSLRR